MSEYTFLTTNELSMCIKYDARTIREQAGIAVTSGPSAG